MGGSFGTIEDMVRDGQSITNFTDGGHCSSCGGCCSDFLLISDAEIKRIKRYIREHGIKEKTCNVASTPLNMMCPFRDEMKKICTIYEVRPEICRVFLCSQPRRTIEANKRLYAHTRKVVSMRHVFFDNPYSDDFMRMVLNETGLSKILPMKEE